MSSRTSISWICAILLALVLSAPASAAFLSRSTGARPLALGNAYVGLADDCAALFTSPAGLAALPRLNLTSMYSQIDQDSLYTSLGGASPLLGGTVGLGYRAQLTSNVTISSTEVANFSQQELILAFGRNLTDNLALGGDLRLLSKGVSKDFPGSDGVVGSGTAFDFSLKYRYQPYFSLGLAWQEVNGQVKLQNNVIEQFAPNIVVGSSLKAWGEDGFYHVNNRGELLLNFDLSKEQDGPFLSHGGLEWTLLNAFALRAGAEQTSTGLVNYTNLTTGLGIKFSGFAFDYAFYKQGDPSAANTHYFSLSYIGLPEQKPTVIVVYATPEPVAVEKTPRVKFADVPAGHWAKEDIELLATAGLLWGYPDGSFKPNQKLTRAEFETILATAKHLPPSVVDNPGKLISRAEAAAQLELAEKVSRPTAPLTRAELAKFLAGTSFGQAAIKRLPPLAD